MIHRLIWRFICISDVATRVFAEITFRNDLMARPAIYDPEYESVIFDILIRAYYS